MSDEQRTGSGEATQPAGPFARLGADIDYMLRNFAGSGEACEHFAHARIEMLKGIRAIIDARIDRLSSERRKGTAIKIE